MKRYFLPLFLLLTVSPLVKANVLSPEEALDRANSSKSILNSRIFRTPGVKSPGFSSFELRYTIETDAKQPALYVFDKPGERGFLIVSADDTAAPVLGYSDTDNFDAGNIPPQMEYWLKEYGRQIAASRSAGTSGEGATTVFPNWDPIEPLVTAKWNQGDPFNLYCYDIEADGTQNKSVTGCVATAMAQVMYYFRYPETGHGSVEYQHPGSGTYSMNFGDQAFEWSEMLPQYYPGSYTTEQADAVAYLMKACGYSVHMNYGKGESGASGSEIGPALIDYFGYNEDIVVRTRKFYTYLDWASMVYKNLSECGPVVYDGSALDGGHSFVCDGYDGNGYFHINWGWGGMSDGYYLLDALNADEFGIGGAAGGFNLGQQVIFGINPKETGIFGHELMQYGTLEGKISDGKLTLQLSGDGAELVYADPLTTDVTIGVEVINTSNPEESPRYIELKPAFTGVERGKVFKLDELDPEIELSSLALTEGDNYNITLVALINGAEKEGAWTPVEAMPGKSNKVTVKSTSSGYEITNYATGALEVEDFRIMNETVYLNLPLKLSATFVNNGDVALTRNYSAVFFNESGTECYKTENYSVNINAGESATVEWSALQWYKENDSEEVTEATVFNVKLYDNWEGEYVEGIDVKVTVEPEPKDSKVEGTLSIPGATEVDGVYVVDSTEFEAQITVKVIEGYFTSTINLGIEKPMSDGDYYTLMHKHFDAVPDLAAGEEQTWTMEMSLPDAEPGIVYRLRIWSPAGEFAKPISVRFNITPDSLSALKGEETYNVYSVSGVKIMTTGDASELRKLPHGLYIVNGKKVAL